MVVTVNAESWSIESVHETTSLDLDVVLGEVSGAHLLKMSTNRQQASHNTPSTGSSRYRLFISFHGPYSSEKEGVLICYKWQKAEDLVFMEAMYTLTAIENFFSMQQTSELLFWTTACPDKVCVTLKRLLYT